MRRLKSLKPPKTMIDTHGRKYRSSLAASHGRAYDLRHSPMIGPAASVTAIDPERTLSAIIRREISTCFVVAGSRIVENALFSGKCRQRPAVRNEKLARQYQPL